MPTNTEIIGLALDRITAGYVFPQRVVGVVPDLATTSGQALAAAHKDALHRAA
ncbi:hypothetical protein [Kitasatospora sp. NPDC088264]|uniref:hypothetical protein n=1 Tax=unclassified Kitasatospora TaxID=2633591 RepID=UPI0034394FCE